MFIWKDADADRRVRYLTDVFGIISEAALLTICDGMDSNEIQRLIERQALKKMPVCLYRQRSAYYIPCDNKDMHTNGVSELNARRAFVTQDAIMTHAPENFAWFDDKEIYEANAAARPFVTTLDMSLRTLSATCICDAINADKPERTLFVVVSRKLRVNTDRLDELARLYGADNTTLIVF